MADLFPQTFCYKTGNCKAFYMMHIADGNREGYNCEAGATGYEVDTSTYTYEDVVYEIVTDFQPARELSPYTGTPYPGNTGVLYPAVIINRAFHRVPNSVAQVASRQRHVHPVAV